MIPESKKPEVLYLHVPFCRTICAYCDFCHTVYRRETAEKWLDALEKELRETQVHPELETIYIGGGTPTALSAEQLERLLSLLDPYAHKVREYTIEINPETLDEEKTEILAAHGVNRASIGFQSSDEGLLKMMNRHHTMEMMREKTALLKRCGIDNYSLDLMYSLPQQTMEQLEQSLADALSLQPKHLSLYSLTIEENTVFGKKGYEHLDEDTEADMYEMICRTLEEKGYEQYEISNFCRPGYASRHNTAYWHYEDFYGISCGASGKEGNVRYDHVRSLKQYLLDPMAREETVLDEDDMMFECVMMGLRLKEGFRTEVFASRYGHTPAEVYGEKLESLKKRGLVEENEGYLRCTDKGYAILNSVLVELL